VDKLFSKKGKKVLDISIVWVYNPFNNLGMGLRLKWRELCLIAKIKK